MNTRVDFVSVAILVLSLLLLPAIPLSGEVNHESAFRLSGDGKVTLVDAETGERLSVKYRNGKGNYNEKALKAIDHQLRCHGSDEVFPISLKLVEFVDYLQDRFGVDEIRVTSGYRTPDYNKMVRRKLRRAAKDSLHMQGLAMDIQLPGIGKVALARYAIAMNFGGVGKYRNSHFIHIDSGPVRSW